MAAGQIPLLAASSVDSNCVVIDLDMCRLYGFRASEATKVECTLVHAQNALIVQSREDLAGSSHANGWGVATYAEHQPHIERQAWAAYHGEHFRRAAARIFSPTVIAHVRRATVGTPKIANTHPFSYGPWAFIHNGTVPAFDLVRRELLDDMTDRHRNAIGGDTDSEHVFHFLMALHEAEPDRPIADIVRQGANQIVRWCQDLAPGRRLGLNVILTDGRQMVGTRLGRTLHYVVRDGVHDCEICGFPHVHHDPHRDYHALVVASEPISHEVWHEVPDGSLWRMTNDFRIEISGLQSGASTKS